MIPGERQRCKKCRQRAWRYRRNGERYCGVCANSISRAWYERTRKATACRRCGKPTWVRKQPRKYIKEGSYCQRCSTKVAAAERRALKPPAPVTERDLDAVLDNFGPDNEHRQNVRERVLHVRVNRDFLVKVQRAAQKNSMTVSSYVLDLVEKGMRA